MKKYPEIKLFRTCSSLEPTGVAKAIEELGLQGQVKIVGTGTPNDLRGLVEDGTMSYICTWDPAAACYAMLTLAQKILSGEPIEDGVDLKAEGWNEMHFFDEDKTASALRSIYRYNFMEHAGDFMNPCRLYCLDEESGLRICVWPEGRRRPFIGAPYSEETMHGFEYAAASMMIRHGMEEEGLRCVKAVRDRYDGRYRNPWNEFECGSNYARSMASFALLLVYSGLSYDLYEQRLGFAPLHPKDFACLWSLEGAWGQVRYGEGSVSIRLMDGALRLKRLDLNLEGLRPKTLLVDGQSLAFRAEEGALLCSEAFTAKREIRVLFE